jgi:acyl-CoA thioester hydrolase
MRDLSAHTVHRPAIVRTRYAETDQMGFVYHSHFFAYFEVGRVELVRATGTSYAALEEHGIMLPLRECGAQFHRAARYDDLLAIGTRVELLTAVRLRFGYQVHRIAPEGATHLATGFTDHLFMDRNGRPARVNRRPEVWRILEPLAAFAAFPEIDVVAILNAQLGTSR